MAQRSPYNERYKKESKIGTTRRSAASAKPKREAGELPARQAKAKAKPSSAKGKSRRGYMADPPEAARFRRLWWVALVVAFAAAGAMLIPVIQKNTVVVGIVWGLWAASMITAFYLDWFVIRRIRAAAAEAGKGKSGKGEGKSGAGMKKKSDGGNADTEKGA